MKRSSLLLILLGLMLMVYGQHASHRKLSGYVRQAVAENRHQLLTRSIDSGQKGRSITAFVRIEKGQAEKTLSKYG